MTKNLSCHVEEQGDETSQRRFFGTLVPQNDGAFYCHVERSETSKRFFGTIVPQNDGALYGHVEEQGDETSHRFFGTYVPQNDRKKNAQNNV